MLIIPVAWEEVPTVGSSPARGRSQEKYTSRLDLTSLTRMGRENVFNESTDELER